MSDISICREYRHRLYYLLFISFLSFSVKGMCFFVLERSKTMKLSKRIMETQSSPIRKFYVYSREAEAKGKKVYYLNIGQPNIKTPDVFFDTVKNFPGGCR